MFENYLENSFCKFSKLENKVDTFLIKKKYFQNLENILIKNKKH